MTTILTTTGISLYLNTRRDYKTAPNPPTDAQMRDYLSVDPVSASAETNSLLQIAQSDDYLILLPTDTPEAEICANLLKEFFIKERGFKPFQVQVKKLQFRDDEKHIETHGLRNLVNALAHEIDEAHRNQQDVVINATPGFKLEIVYSTMIGMLYQVPVKYLHEKFRNVVTLNPIALAWDTSIIFNNNEFFQWLGKSKPQKEVEDRLKGLYDRARIESMLTPPDDSGNMFLSPIGEVLQLTFKRETETAEQLSWPKEVQVKNVKDKIANSIVKHGHDYPKWTENICIKIAQIPYVLSIIPRHFNSVPRSRIAHIYENGVIEVHWTEGGKTAILTITTTAENFPQSYKVAEEIRKRLKIKERID